MSPQSCRVVRKIRKAKDDNQTFFTEARNLTPTKRCLMDEESPDWLDVVGKIMKFIVKSEFSQNRILSILLICFREHNHGFAHE